MKKTSNLVYIGGMLLCVISILAQNSYAQKSVKAKTDEPQKQAKKSILQTYIDISALSVNDRRAAFIDLSAEDKAGIFKFHLAFQIVKRPNLTKEQKDLILESIGSISIDTYDFTKDRTGAQAMAINIQVRAAPLFSKQEMFEIFASLGGNKEDIELLQSYANLSKLSGPNRKETFRGSMPNERANLWRAHVALYLAEHSEMNVSQKDFILDVIDFLTPDTFGITSDNPQWESKVNKPVLAFVERVLQLFTKEEAANLLTRLGGPQAASPPKSGGIQVSTSSPNPVCQCHRGIGDLCSSICTGNICNPTSVGCGVFFVQPCNGTDCLVEIIY